MTTNRTTVQVRDTQVIAGIGKRLQNVPSVLLLGTAYAPADLTKLLQSQIASATNIAVLRAQLTDAVQADRALATKVTALIRALKAFVINAFGNTSEVLGDFGFASTKTQPKNPVTKVVAAEKALATRKARGTKGKRQKEKIKGTVPATISIAVLPAEPSAAPVVNGGVTALGANGAPAQALKAQ